MIDEIKGNIQKEKELIQQLKTLIDEKKKSPGQAEFYNKSILSIIELLDSSNRSIPDLLEEKRSASLSGASVNKKEKERIMGELNIEEDLLKSIKKKEKIEGKKEAMKIGGFSKTASRIFSNIAFSLKDREFFAKLKNNLKKSNMPYLLANYVSMVLLMTLISLIVSLLIAGFLIINGQIGFGLAFLALPIIVFFFAFFYPSSQSSSIEGKIEDELPFAIIHMAAISGSGVTPLHIFQIIAQSGEYPAISIEMRKIINQINLYGYNLVNALRNTAKSTASQRLADLLNGIATTISSGGNLRDYLDKNASDTLTDYKLRRRRYTTISETYADIYTGLLIAAPMIFMIILVLVNVLGGGISGMSPEVLSYIGIGAIVVLNIAFIVFLEISQPKG
jgi:pilus assembly protein TadC